MTTVKIPARTLNKVEKIILSVTPKIVVVIIKDLPEWYFDLAPKNMGVVGVNNEFLAVYRNRGGQTVEFPIVRDEEGSYRLCANEGLRPIRWFVGDLEFEEYRPVNPNGNAGQFMNQILSTPATKTRPAFKREENAA